MRNSADPNGPCQGPVQEGRPLGPENHPQFSPKPPGPFFPRAFSHQFYFNPISGCLSLGCTPVA